jgi:hypothetical protein
VACGDAALSCLEIHCPELAEKFMKFDFWTSNLWNLGLDICY